ncbi:MAG: polymer-forming cytoskeletal protein [Patescibacteria group bacterium]|nr:polymer-forming cytoskeletal protein [Patescibacteria group bacterium]
MKKKYFLLFAAMFLAVLWAVPVSAAQFQGGESITITSVEDDVYAAGANIFADGEIVGDLYAAGAIVRNNANVSQDVVMAGSMVDLFGNVGDDARLAGSMVSIGGIIEDDLIVFGGMVRLLPGSVVKGDLSVFGGSVMIDGIIEGNVLGGGGQVILNGEVKGSAMLEVDELILGNSAVVGGVMQYTSSKDAKIDDGASVVGGIDHKVPEQPKKDASRDYKAPDVDKGALFGLGVMAFIFKVLIGIVTVLVALYFFKSHLLEMTKTTLSKFPAQLGWGTIWAIVVPIVSIILLITIFGSALGGFALIVYVLTFAIAKALAMIAFGAWVWKLATKSQTVELDWKIALIGVLGLNLIWLIPLIGWVFCMVFTLAALGATVNYLKNAIKS